MRTRKGRMDRLARLRKPLEEMTPEEKHDLIRLIRLDRRVTKERPKERRKVARTKDKAKTDLSKLLDGLSPEEIQALLGEMGDDAG